MRNEIDIKEKSRGAIRNISGLNEEFQGMKLQFHRDGTSVSSYETPAHTSKNHPVFRNFPTDYYSDLQWWELVNRQQVMLLSDFPEDFRPIVQSIDTWFLSRKIGMLFEANVNGGKLMMTTLPLDAGEAYPVRTQMRKAILDYMASEDFRPSQAIDWDCVKALFSKDTPKVNLYTRDSPDELKPPITPKH